MAAAYLTAVSGSFQSANLSAAFAQPLVVLVRDASNVAVAGVTVTFTVPGMGASCTLAGSAVSDLNGRVTRTATANGTAGSYHVTCTAAGTVGCAFTLGNVSATPTCTSSTRPTVAVQEGTGGNFWTAPTKILSNDGTGAAAAVPAAAQSFYLIGRKFGFAVPANATITGFILKARLKSTLNNTNCYAFLQKTANGAFTPLASGQNLIVASTSLLQYTLGGSSDRWGNTTYTPAEVNADSFGMAIQVRPNSAVTAHVTDYLLSICYTVPASVPNPVTQALQTCEA